MAGLLHRRSRLWVTMIYRSSACDAQEG